MLHWIFLCMYIDHDIDDDEKLMDFFDYFSRTFWLSCYRSFICEEHRVVNMLRGHLTLRWVTVRYKFCWHFASISFFFSQGMEEIKKAENEKNALPEIVMLHIKLDTCFIHLYHPHAAQLSRIYGGNINLFIVWLLLVSECMHIFFSKETSLWEMTLILIQP